MKEALLAAGFKQFTQRCLGHERAVANYQKCFRCPIVGDKRYFVTVHEYNYADLPGVPANMPNGFLFTAQFREGGADNSQCVDVSLSGKEASELPGILNMIELMWEASGCMMYERY